MLSSRSGLGFAFEACACRGAFHVGVVQELWRAGIRPARVAGASSGAIIAAAVALGLADDLDRLWLDLAGQRVFQPLRMLRGHWPFQMSEIVSGALGRVIGSRTLGEVSTELSVVITVVERGRLVPRVITSADAHLRLIDVLMASAFIPGIYHKPCWVDGRLALDGGWVARTAVPQILVGPQPRGIAVVSSAWAARPTEIARWTRAPERELRIIQPKNRLRIRSFDFDREVTMEAIAEGRSAAARFLDAHAGWVAA